MTYYGRWTYKFEIGAEKGAAGVLVVHETGPAGYPFQVVQDGFTGERFDLVTPDKNMGRSPVEAWVSLDAAKKLLQMGGQDFDKLKALAATRDFKPVPLGVTASMTLQNKLNTINSQNVVAKIEGSDPARKDEYVVYTAHWDHFGKRDEGIFHGAEDNAMGTSALIEVARAFTKLPSPPRRSILFLAVTAEEQGLLGSEYYAVTPIYPLAKTVANINMDSWNLWGRTKDLTIVGLGASDLDDYVRDAAAEQGRVVQGDAEPEKGFYYRSDHFAFAKQGVPALNPEGGTEYIGKPADFGQKVRDEWTANRYHKPGDVVLPGLGPHRCPGGSQGVLRRRLSRGAGRQVPRMETGKRVQGQARRDAEEVNAATKARRLEKAQASGLERVADALRARQVRDPDRVVRQRRARRRAACVPGIPVVRQERRRVDEQIHRRRQDERPFRERGGAAVGAHEGQAGGDSDAGDHQLGEHDERHRQAPERRAIPATVPC